jgi:hypothetical protein
MKWHQGELKGMAHKVDRLSSLGSAGFGPIWHQSGEHVLYEFDAREPSQRRIDPVFISILASACFSK